MDLEKQIEETREELANSKNKHDELLSEVQKSLENKVTSLSEQETILNNNIEALTNKYQVLESNFGEYAYIYVLNIASCVLTGYLYLGTNSHFHFLYFCDFLIR